MHYDGVYCHRLIITTVKPQLCTYEPHIWLQTTGVVQIIFSWVESDEYNIKTLWDKKLIVRLIREHWNYLIVCNVIEKNRRKTRAGSTITRLQKNRFI